MSQNVHLIYFTCLVFAKATSHPKLYLQSTLNAKQRNISPLPPQTCFRFFATNEQGKYGTKIVLAMAWLQWVDMLVSCRDMQSGHIGLTREGTY
jgi:hypothetical protein